VLLSGILAVNAKWLVKDEKEPAVFRVLRKPFAVSICRQTGQFSPIQS
jgi:hypothetical protein